jgi:hypothetical protein
MYREAPYLCGKRPMREGVERRLTPTETVPENGDMATREPNAERRWEGVPPGRLGGTDRRVMLSGRSGAPAPNVAPWSRA